MTPVLRFAPSPTGYLHIGGARTALFNWLYARARGGKFLLRIEDTDRARHNEDAVQAILDGLAWLGLDWDGDPISQFSRRERHVEVARQLLSSGAAYRCYLTPEEVDETRKAAREAGERFVSPWRERNDGAEDRPYTVRFRAPESGETIVNDAVQGRVAFPNSALDDLIILRSTDGADKEEAAPTYNLAVVVDDHDMGVTHVVRGDDHLANAARQQQIYEALGWQTPVFAHVPLIHGPDGAKLSKRHGALGVEAYRDDGYLADALANYLLRLGWAHGDEEIIPLKRALEVFDLTGINKAPARLDLDKLSHINSVYLSQMSDDAFLAAAAPFLEAAAGPLDETVRDRLKRASTVLKGRMATLKEAPEAAKFLLLQRPLEITGKAAKPLKKDGARNMLADITAHLTDAGDIWGAAESLEAALQGLAEAKNVGFGQVGPPLRAALTAGAPAPALGEVIHILGKQESLARISDQLLP